jgi:hypothetical protein
MIIPILFNPIMTFYRNRKMLRRMKKTVRKEKRGALQTDFTLSMSDFYMNNNSPFRPNSQKMI